MNISSRYCFSLVMLFSSFVCTPDLGLAAGPNLVKDINKAQRGSDPYNTTKVGNVLFFVSDDAQHGWELWKL